MAKVNSLFAMESEDAVLDSENPEKDLDESIVNNIAAQDADIAETINDIDVASNEMCLMEKTSDIIADDVDNGRAIDSTAAAMAQVAVESVMERLNIKSKQLIPAIEAFDSVNTKTHASKIALENIKDTIKKIWEGVVKGIKTVFEALGKYFSLIEIATASIKSQVQYQTNAVKKLSGNIIREKIQDQRIGFLADKEGKYDEYAILQTHLNFTKNALLPEDVVKSINESVNKAISNTDSALGDQDALHGAVSKETLTFVKHFEHLTNAKAAYSRDDNGDKVTEIAIGPFYKHKYVAIKHIKPENGLDKLEMRIKDLSTADSNGMSYSYSVNTFTKENIIHNLVAIADLIKTNDKYREEFPKWKKTCDNILTSADKLSEKLLTDSKNTIDEKFSLKTSLLRNLRSVFTSNAAVGNKLLSTMPRLNVDLCTTVLILNRKSMYNLE